MALQRLLILSIPSKWIKLCYRFGGLADIAAFIGYGFVGISWGLYYAIVVIVPALASVFVSALVIDALASSFGSEKNMGWSVQLVAYSFTPAWIGGLLAVVPALAMIGSLFGIYGLYLLYLGMPVLKKTPQDTLVGYFVVSLLVTIVVYIVVGMILGAILMPLMGLSMGGGFIESIRVN